MISKTFDKLDIGIFEEARLKRAAQLEISNRGARSLCSLKAIDNFVLEFSFSLLY
jgi:hypothetical protein